jgi:hypothetical protein
VLKAYNDSKGLGLEYLLFQLAFAATLDTANSVENVNDTRVRRRCCSLGEP